ncbi:hypothetical protein FOPG_19512 [Fusarium oxysporum f. sp. conglutinans race 2 54008]|uniref:Uncharacterized protein n=1 Tax=Fusarium oxysporum f. sp. conglutinans race 2 54008 TaxID=1089457 RepID=X0GKQ3_FUSOX|nr:hypothetical protein FOPG_19512 [Fusarium oxysporum f. sp. conglutinans race 2 54008]
MNFTMRYGYRHGQRGQTSLEGIGLLVVVVLLHGPVMLSKLISHLLKSKNGFRTPVKTHQPTRNQEA